MGSKRGTVTLLGTISLAMALLSVSHVAALDEGDRAPAISLRSLDGERIQVPRGKVVIVDFWASWCDPCREAMPNLERLYRRYRERGLVVLGISVDRNERNARRFLRRTQVSFPVALDEGQEVAGRYRPPRMPSTYVIDRRGRVRHVHEGFRPGDMERLEDMVRDLL